MSAPRVLPPSQLALRSLQTAAAVSALCATLYGYRVAPQGSVEASGPDSDSLANLAVLLIALTLYSAALWSTYHVLVLEVWNLAPRRPSGGCQRVIDGLHAVFALAAGVLLVSVDAFRTCGDSNQMRCGALRAGAALSLFVGALFAVSLGLGCLEKAATAAAIIDVTTAAAVPQDMHGSAVYTIPRASTIRDTTRSEREISKALCASDLAELRRGARFLQLGGSIIALVNVLLGFKRAFLGTDATAAAVFAVLATYTSAIFSGWHLLFVDLCELSPPLALNIERTVEAAFTVLLVTVGFVFEVVDLSENCDGECTGHTAAVAFTFITASAFIIDLAFAFSKYRDAKVLTPVPTPTTEYQEYQDLSPDLQRDQHHSTNTRALATSHV